MWLVVMERTEVYEQAKTVEIVVIRVSRTHFSPRDKCLVGLVIVHQWVRLLCING